MPATSLAQDLRLSRENSRLRLGAVFSSRHFQSCERPGILGPCVSAHVISPDLLGLYRANSPGLLHRPRSSSAIQKTAVGHKLALTLVTKRAVGAFADHGCVVHATHRVGRSPTILPPANASSAALGRVLRHQNPCSLEHQRPNAI